jgi:glycosyltransferase involved in cell wall biosynthesis
LSETLNSILDQTYENWECIVDDVVFTEDSEFIVWKFVKKKDNRFRYYKKPKDKQDTCRNSGFGVCGRIYQLVLIVMMMLPSFITERDTSL